MLGYFKSIFKNWKNLERNSERHEVDLKRLSGRFGEEKVSLSLHDWAKGLKISKKQTQKCIRILEQLRIPDPIKNRKSEIDAAILCGDKVVLIEVKNWGGTVESTDSGSFNQTPASSSKTISHHNPLKHLENKKKNLITYLQKKGTSKIKVYTALVFVSESLELFLTKKERNYCFFIPELIDFLDNKLEIKEFDPSILSCLEDLPTWDQVELYGGKILTGDIVGNRILFNEDIKLDRRHHKIIDFYPVRKWWQLFRIPHVKIRQFEKYFREKLQCDMDQRLTFLPAGNSDTIQIPLHQIHTITLGWRNDEYRRKPISEYEQKWFTGRVVAEENYGIFVQLDELETGLLHNSIIEESGKTFTVGQRIKVFVNSSSKESHGKRRFELLLHKPAK